MNTNLSMGNFQDLATTFRELLRMTPDQMTKTSAPDFLKTAAVNAQNDIRFGGERGAPPNSTVAENVLRTAMGNNPPPQMPPQGVPGMDTAPQMPPQGAQAGGYIHDYGVASLPYTPKYEHGGIVSFQAGGYFPASYNPYDDPNTDLYSRIKTPEEEQRIQDAKLSLFMSERPENRESISEDERKAIASRQLRRAETPFTPPAATWLKNFASENLVAKNQAREDEKDLTKLASPNRELKQGDPYFYDYSKLPPKADSKFDVTQTLPSDYDQIGINSDAAIKAMQGATGGQNAGIAALGRGPGGKSAVAMLKESGALQDVPGEKTVSDFMKEKQKARVDAGVKDVYAAQREKYKAREAELTGDKDKSVGKALMSAGVALMGGKNWAEGFAKAGEAGLAAYSADMDKIEARRDKLQEASDLLDRAEYAEKVGDVDKAVELRRENEKIIREVKHQNAESLLNATLVDKKELGDNYRTMVQAQLAAGNTDKQIMAGLYETKIKLQAAYKEAQIGYDKAMDVANAQARLEFAKDKRKAFETLVTAAMKNDALMQEAQEIVLKKYPNEPGRVGEILQDLARGEAVKTMNYMYSIDEIDSTMASLSSGKGGIASIQKVQ